jgi:hypothetical protein
MHIGTRIFNKVSSERDREVKRMVRVKRELDGLLVEFDKCQAADQIAVSPSAVSKRAAPRFVAQTERVDLNGRSEDRRKAIDQFAQTVSTRSLNEAWQNGEHLSYLASLIVSDDRPSLELQYEIQTALCEYTDSIFRIQLIDRLMLGMINTEPVDNESVSEFVQAYRTALENIPV